ncbi:MAG TPA: aromatic-ring-hydroxylating dioxygenase subunit beta [Stellaceae bacterium]|jgi:anthranilate 1,2-dioxygenase small subunit|nr:aromatic-ring-hydroxylating dioxygenase subunit beta [Stellaceae bacterium]
MTPDEVVRRLEFEALYAEYAHCLDNDRLEDWPGYFTEECAYRVISAESFEAGMPLGIIYATSRNMLVDRVMALRKANIYEPQRYRHLIANIRPLDQTNPREDDAGIDVTANFIVVRTMQDGAMTLFAAGRYVDRLVRIAGEWRFARKDAVLDSRQIDTLLAIPI